MNEIKCPKCGEVFQVDAAGYAAILKQVHDSEFHKELSDELKKQSAQKDLEIQLLQQQAKSDTEKLISDYKTELTKLQTKIEAMEQDKKIAVNEAISAQTKNLAQKNEEILRLESSLRELQTSSQLSEQKLKSDYESALKIKEQEIEHYKDLKAKLSTKMLGETLEQHCEAEFNKLRATAFKNAYFEKDNDAKTGSKGDYIFRDFAEDGTESISIMFEMKNENETTSTKKKNEDFFKELDKDRTEKKCEYAILVSLLEAESELYNTGIVDVSYKYPKMYVIRPQFFIQMITLLRDAALNSISYKKQLVEYKNQNIDVSNFEAKINDFKDKFGRNYQLAKDHFDEAIASIDKSISDLQKTRDKLLASENNLRLANNKAQELTVKRLTRGNQTMTKMFEDLNK